MCLPSGLWINIEQPAQDHKIRLMKHKRRRFPEVVVKPLLQIVLGSAENCAKQLGTGVVGDRFPRDGPIG
jgi:hypothetical protein